MRVRSDTSPAAETAEREERDPAAVEWAEGRGEESADDTKEAVVATEPRITDVLEREEEAAAPLLANERAVSVAARSSEAVDTTLSASLSPPLLGMRLCSCLRLEEEEEAEALCRWMMSSGSLSAVVDSSSVIAALAGCSAMEAADASDISPSLSCMSTVLRSVSLLPLPLLTALMELTALRALLTSCSCCCSCCCRSKASEAVAEAREMADTPEAPDLADTSLRPSSVEFHV